MKIWALKKEIPGNRITRVCAVFEDKPTSKQIRDITGCGLRQASDLLDKHFTTLSNGLRLDLTCKESNEGYIVW